VDVEEIRVAMGGKKAEPLGRSILM